MEKFLKSSTIIASVILWQCTPRNDTFNFPVTNPKAEMHSEDHHDHHGHHESENNPTGKFGAEFEIKNLVKVQELPKLLEKQDSVLAVFEGKIAEVCQKKGCWMTLDLGNNLFARVTFKDYKFFVPKNAAGRKAILKGIASKEILTVEMLRHYAQDRGASEKEIQAITQPETEWSIVAEGVVIE